jgi:hypothetical protein
MLRNLKLIFIHGISAQNTNYAQALFAGIMAAARRQLAAQGQDPAAIETTLRAVVEHEILWANFTTDLTNRYLQLAYPLPFFWGALTRPVDPLVIQILEYVKDKGDKASGVMNILSGVDQEFQTIFGYTDIGQDPAPGEGHHAIVIGHSLGSVIAFDYLFGFRPHHRLHRNITVPSFITLGSPLPLFTSAMGHPDSDVTLPTNVQRWVNIRSPRDAVARPLRPFFRNIPIDEHLVRTSFWPFAAHTAYQHDPATANLIAAEVIRALRQQ